MAVSRTKPASGNRAGTIAVSLPNNERHCDRNPVECEEYVFPGKCGVLGHATLWKILKSLPGCGAWTVYRATRSGFSTWREGCMHYREELVQIALSHVKGSAVKRACARRDMLEKRRTMMNAWARFPTTVKKD
jgi:hypothetical protein